MKTENHGLFSSEPQHPGRLVRELIDQQNLRVSRFCLKYDLDHLEFADFLKGDLNMNGDIAYALSKEFGISKDSWFEMQSEFIENTKINNFYQRSCEILCEYAADYQEFSALAYRIEASSSRYDRFSAEIHFDEENFRHLTGFQSSMPAKDMYRLAQLNMLKPAHIYLLPRKRDERFPEPERNYRNWQDKPKNQIYSTNLKTIKRKLNAFPEMMEMFVHPELLFLQTDYARFEKYGKGSYFALGNGSFTAVFNASGVPISLLGGNQIDRTKSMHIDQIYAKARPDNGREVLIYEDVPEKSRQPAGRKERKNASASVIYTSKNKPQYGGKSAFHSGSRGAKSISKDFEQDEIGR
jgi:plasmid maintenance system antidote protein VapI